VLLAVAGCSFDRSGIGGDDVAVDAPPGTIDGVTGDPDGANGCITWAAPNVDPCDPLLPDPEPIALVDDDYTYDTDSGLLGDGSDSTMPPSATLPQDDGPDVRVLNVRNFEIEAGGTLTVTGSRPLIIVSHGPAVVAGTIDVSARFFAIDNSSAPGPGGNNSIMCGNGTRGPGDPSTNVAAGGGGGGGGGFGDDAGDGGDGQGGGHGNKGPKGTTNGNPELVPLRGGCGGARGGDDADGAIDASGRAGDGGGAIEITSRTTLTVDGTIRASGSGGAAAQLANAGGGGGGSGGAILLDADNTIIGVTGALCANGGGGGEGGQVLVATAEDGDFALCSETIEAQGGELSDDGGNGGDGGALSDPNGDNAANGGAGAGGGGGGGGVGRIRVIGRTVRAVPTAAIVSPAAVE
jgi:hypothetical protein